jgi:hypothetical protein
MTPKEIAWLMLALAGQEMPVQLYRTDTFSNMRPPLTHLEAEMFARFTKFAVVALALAVGGQAKAANLTYGTYYEDTETTSCSATTNCRLNFLQFPTNNLVMINKLNCAISATSELGSLTLDIAAVSGGSPVAGGRFLPLGLPNPTFISNTYLYNFQQDAQYLIGQARFPYLAPVASLGGTSTTAMSCTIVGTLVTPIQ